MRTLLLAALMTLSACAAQPETDPRLEQAWKTYTIALQQSDFTAFYALLDDEASVSFPSGQWKGVHEGKDRVMAFYDFVASIFPDGLTSLQRTHTTGTGDHWIVEFTSAGTLYGKPYRNRIALSLEFCGEKICAIREYVGADGSWN